MSEESCTYLEWDSAFFECRIGRVNGSRVDRARMAEILRWCREHAIDCLYLLADSADPVTIRLAEATAFRLVDIRLTFEWRDRAPGPVPESVVVRPAHAGDLAELEAIAGTIHQDARFYVDPRFTRRASSLYRTWIARSVEGYADVVWVAELEARAVGYVSCHLEGEGGRIGLVGVGPAAQGRGVGPAMLNRAVTWFREQGARQILVVTQGRNLAAQRLYQRCGFVTRSVQLWYHKWFDENSWRPPNSAVA